MSNISQQSTSLIASNRLLVPPGFPVLPYNSIHRIIESNRSQHSLYEQYSGAWNALAYRFRAAVDHKDSFISSINKHGATPPPEERYLQERLLFDFFSSAFATFEATFYALYCVGAFIAPTHFPLSSEREQQKVSPVSTQRAYGRAFPADSVLSSFSNLFADPTYQQLREIRNVLTHRTAPGRRMYVSIGDEVAPATEWKLNNIPVDESIVTNATRDLSRLLVDLLIDYENFTKRYII